MTEEVIIGIDLGTTFSAVAFVNAHGRPQMVRNAEGAYTTPSVVYFEEGGTAVVGADARNLALADPDRTVQFIKRHIGDPSFQLKIDGEEYVPEAISGLILKKLRDDAAASLGKEVRRAVVSVPAYFKDSQRSATRKAGEMAGLEVVAIINEPTAAAIAYGLGRQEQQRRVLVYDFGGGTFDVTILSIEGNEFTVLATDGDSTLGGIDVDERVANYLATQVIEQKGVDLREDTFTRIDLYQRAELAKIQLSSRQSVSVMLSAGAETMRVDLDRDKLRELSADLLERTRECMERCVSAAGLQWSAIESLLLVGGSSRMVAVRELARSVTATDPSVDVNPDECVALGAALRAHLAEVAERTAEPRPSTGPVPADPPEEVSIVIHDVAPHSLGVRALAADGRPVNSIIIPRLTVVPCERRRTYATRADNQKAIEVEILQGEAQDPFSPEVEPIGRLRIDELPARPAGGVVVAVALRYDADGVVEVVAEELIEGRTVREQLLRKSGELDPELIERMKDQIERLSAEPEDGADGVLQEADARTDERVDPMPPGIRPEDADVREPEEPSASDGRVDLYSLLGVERDADPAQIENAIRALREEWADIAARDSDERRREQAETQIAAIDQAQEILLDPAARAEYDALSEPSAEDGIPPEPSSEGEA